MKIPQKRGNLHSKKYGELNFVQYFKEFHYFKVHYIKISLYDQKCKNLHFSVFAFLKEIPEVLHKTI